MDGSCPRLRAVCAPPRSATRLWPVPCRPTSLQPGASDAPAASTLRDPRAGPCDGKPGPTTPPARRCPQPLPDPPPACPTLLPSAVARTATEAPRPHCPAHPASPVACACPHHTRPPDAGRSPARTGPVTGAPPAAPAAGGSRPQGQPFDSWRGATCAHGRGRRELSLWARRTRTVMVPGASPGTACLSPESWGLLWKHAPHKMWPCSDGILRTRPHPPSAVLVTTERGGTQPPARKHLGLPGRLGRERGPVTPRFGTPGSRPWEDELLVF